MPLLQPISKAVVSYRLGYSPQRLPLSAYEIVQESTFRPNDTLPPLPLSNMIPGILQHSTDGFTPQILTVGDGIQLNNFAFKFIIAEAFDKVDSTHPVSSFSYYNNKFSDGCDVTNMTASIAVKPTESLVTLAVTVTCHIPTLFRLTWNGVAAVPAATDSARDDFSRLASDTAAESLFPTKPPCSFLPARFSVIQVSHEDSYSPVGPTTYQLDPNTTAVFAPMDPFVFGLPDDTPMEAMTSLNTFFQNTFQALYHRVRLELGIVLENQIYGSPEMYNHSISNVYAPIPPWAILLNSYSSANRSRLSTSNATLMAQWKEFVKIFKDSDQVPIMPYVRPVPRLKPLGSAMTSVFVSTFAMLSVLWTIFSIVAGAFAEFAGKADYQTGGAALQSPSQIGRDSENKKVVGGERDSIEASPFPSEEHKSQTMLERLSLTVDQKSIQMSIAIAEIQLSLARMRLSLKKRGVLEDDEEEIDAGQKPIGAIFSDQQGFTYSAVLDRYPLLLHRGNRGSDLDLVV
ncbi:hypothetical protein DFH09DRAFT_1271417 [Mycena vulgaris]|nr:hypothetical protein DFH09DRAFT_1271417 [Mycena vulgaris]